MKDTSNERAREFLADVEAAAKRAQFHAVQMAFGGHPPPIEYLRDFYPDLVDLHPDTTEDEEDDETETFEK